jgi:hypothetical protein
MGREQLGAAHDRSGGITHRRNVERGRIGFHHEHAQGRREKDNSGDGKAAARRNQPPTQPAEEETDDDGQRSEKDTADNGP